MDSLVELGQLIGFDLKIDNMLLQIAQKAAEIMEADRCSLFLYDPKTDELWSKVAMGMEGKVIRIPSGAGMAGYCFKTGETVNLEDAYTDPHFNRDIDARTGYRTRSLLCMPIHKRSGGILGVIELLNKKEGLFTKEDEMFLMTFGNHASVFIEMAQLQTARIEALEHSREELSRLSRAKDKALHHLSHELKTPLSVVQGTLRILRRKIQGQHSGTELKGIFDTLEKAGIPPRDVNVIGGGAASKIWLQMLNLDMIIQAYPLPPELQALAISVNGQMLDILTAGATGEF